MIRKINLAVMLTICSAVCMAQTFVPNTKWPYLNESFEDGTIYFASNQKSDAKLNIHLLGNVLHYVGNDEKVYQSATPDMIRAEIGGKAYVPADGKMMEVIRQDSISLLLKLTEADFDALFSGTGAYGASLNSSAKFDVSSLDLGGLKTPELGKMILERNEGRTITLRTKYYFVVNNQLIEASKRAVERFLGDSRKNQFRRFLKQNKVNWRNEESLGAVIEFINNSETK